MASSLYNLALDFSKELNYTKAIMARQGDKGITVTVKPFLNGLQMDTSGGTFTLKGTTPSNRYVDSVATSITSEEVTFSLDGTFMSEAGYYKHCYVEYRKDDQILTTQDIIFFSLGVSDILQGQADEYVSQLEDLIRKYNETFDAFMAGIKGRVDSLNQQITDLTGQAKTLQEKLDALKEEISKLGNLQVMYSNSIDFGDYDYSGNPNIEQYKYRGIGMRDSNNPKDYVWDLAPEYVEDNLATDVKISEITGKANNYTDGKVSEINSQLTEMQKPVKYEAWFSGGTELRPANANSRFRVSEERLTIGTKLNVAMNKSPLEWNADRWEATFTRECSILVDVQTMVEFADQWGTYVYINMWKDTNQTQTWDTGYGMGTATGTNFWFRTELSVSMYCMNAKVGDKFSIGLGMASGKSLTSARIHKLHIMEL